MIYINYLYTLNKKMKKLLLLTLVLSIFSCTNKESDACTELKNSKILLSDNMENYRSAWEKSFLERDINVLDEYLHENVTHLNEDGVVNATGPEEFKNAYAGYITGFPDSEFLIVNLFGDGDQLIKHWNFKGTHAESGKKVNVYGATLVKMKDGKIFQEQDYWDARKFYKQLAE